MATDNLTTTASAWTETSNPLRNMGQWEIEQMLENARWGLDQKLQVIYHLIEQRTALYCACLEKRAAGLLGRAWDIVPIDGFEKDGKALQQAKDIRKMFAESDERSCDSLSDAFVDLQQGAFRGRAYVKPFICEDGGLKWRKVPNWTVLRGFGRNWLARGYGAMDAIGSDISSWKNSSLVEIPESELCYTVYQRPADLPGITIYLRQLVGETKWAQFIERNGNPQVVVTAPEGTPDANLPLWNQRALQIQNGASGVLPSGATIDELVAARGQDPFSKFIEHQEEMICILAVGGSLNTLGGSTGLGSDLATKQDDQFQSLISMDSKKIQNTITHVGVEKVCRDVLHSDRRVKFQFVEDDDITPQEYLEMAKVARDLGASIDIGKLKELTKLGFISLGKGDEEVEAWSPDDKAGKQTEVDVK